MALPIVKMGIVPASAVNEIVIALVFNVINEENRTPSTVAARGPTINNVFPSVVKGIMSHKRKTKKFTIKSLENSFFMGSPADMTSNIEKNKDSKRAGNLFDMATTIEKINATANLALGSNECITEFPFEKPSSSILVPYLKQKMLCRFPPGDILKEIPPLLEVTKYLGFTLRSIIQSPERLTNPEYLVTSSLSNRYRPGETG